MKANLNKQTDKAINITYKCEIYGETFTIKNVWFPKSQLTINDIQDGVIDFDINNDWLLNLKTKEYCKFIAETFDNVKSEIRTYLSPINNVSVTQCYI